MHGNADALSRKPCNKSCQYCSTVEKKYEIINPMAHQVTASSTSKLDPWSDDGLREALKKDPDIKAILEYKESSSVQQSWQDISIFSPTAKCYWALWYSLHVRNGVLYRKWESNDGHSSKWQLILPNSPFYWSKLKEDVKKWC